MNNLRKTTITTLEVAEMMETEHWMLLRKLEGQEKNGKHIKGFIEILGDNQIVVTDYFIKSTYLSVQNKKMPCYEVTKLGCDFLANKSTGEKGVLFSARYVKRFYEMENRVTSMPITERPGELANLLKVLNGSMRKEGLPEYKIAENERLICEQYGIKVIPDFVKVPAYEQTELMWQNEKE